MSIGVAVTVLIIAVIIGFIMRAYMDEETNLNFLDGLISIILILSFVAMIIFPCLMNTDELTAYSTRFVIFTIIAIVAFVLSSIRMCYVIKHWNPIKTIFYYVTMPISYLIQFFGSLLVIIVTFGAVAGWLHDNDEL